MSENDIPRPERWGRFKFSVIGGLLASPPEGGELQEALEQLALRTYQHPLHPGQSIQFGFSTIESWFYKAKGAQDPLAALRRKRRRDAGVSQALSPEFLAALEAQYLQDPRWTVQLHYDNLAVQGKRNPQWGTLACYQTVRRAMRDRGWVRRKAPRHPTEGQTRAALRLEEREVRSFESSHVHALWHLDFHKGSLKVVDTAGHWHTPIALAILDDRARLCCHLQWYLAETAENLVHGLTQALLKRGLPRALLTDNGSAMLAQETREGLARLSIVQRTTLPYSPYQNGKQEVFWAQLEGRLMALLGRVEDLRLDFLNRASQAWVEQDYHRRTHSETGATPLERLLAGPEVSRPAPSPEALRLAFSRQVSRCHRRSDGTVAVEGIRFEVPSRFRLLPKLTLRYALWDRSTVWVIDPQTGQPLARLLPQDKEKNADGQRRRHELILPSCAPVLSAGKDPIPPLLDQWLADFAATGLPPAYFPKDENESEVPA